MDEYDDIALDGEDDARLEISDEEMEAEREARLQGLSITIKGLRDEAVNGRASSGIEAEWLEDEEYYQGIDDANRGEHWIKPTSPDGRVRVESTPKKSTRSTVFVKLTRPYVDAASARIADMLLPTDDRNWDIRPTPIPENLKNDQSPVIAPQSINPGMGMVGQGQMPGMPAMAPQMTTVGDLAREQENKAKESCEKAKTQIDDWLVECQYHAEVRQVIEDSARLGVGILKGPFPEVTRSRAVVKALEGIGIVIEEKIVPKSRRVDPWNFYPDPGCGEKIQNGKYVFERDEITCKQLQELKGAPGYLEEAIDKVIEEGPKSRYSGETTRPRDMKRNDKELFEIWYYHGYLSADDLEAAGCECEDEEQYPAIVVLVNDTVIKAALQPLDSGEYPYDVMIWQRRPGHWAGVGVARQMRTSQDGVNAAVRNLMDNAGMSSGPILIIDRSKLQPTDGDWTLRSRKVFVTTDSFEGGSQSVKDAITWIVVPNLQAELLNIVQFWQQRAEDETGMPMILQGQLGKAPDTVGGMTMLSNNASSVLRRIARTFDDRVTEPHIGRYYEWLLIHGEDDSAKGDFIIDARGSSALIERDQQNQALMNIYGMSRDPASGLDPELTAKEVLKSLRFDPKKFELSDEKKQQRQPQPDPRIQVAQINAQTEAQKTQFLVQSESQRLQMELSADAQKEQMRLQAEAQRDQMDRALAQWEKNVEAQLKAAEIAGAREGLTEELKVSLAKEAMKLRTQMNLAFNKALPAPQVAVPAMEPPGRAKPGFAYQQ